MGNANERKTEKSNLVTIAVIIAVLICLPSARMRSQQTSTGRQAAQAERNRVVHFNLQNIAGGFMTSDDLKGKVTVVDVWATWCQCCLEETPLLNRLYDSFESKNVAIVGIAVESPRRDIESRVRQLGIKYPILIGDAQTLQAFGDVEAFPTTFVITKEGKVYKQYMGASPHLEERIKQDIADLSAEDSQGIPQQIPRG
jgi:thiol-disulfide isomerase/thioredoxin